MKNSIVIVNAGIEHLDAIAQIYNQAIETRTATFETELRSASDITSWLDETAAMKVAMINGLVAGFAKISLYRDRHCYAGVKEYSVYVEPDFHRQGIGLELLQSLIADCKTAGIWKLVSRIFPENKSSIKLAKQTGFRQVGTYKEHGQLDGVWKDCVIVELSL